MASISKSRFSVLRIEDDEEEVSTADGNAGNKNHSNSSAAKKKKKKKKKDDEDLRNLAFGRQTGRIHKNSGSEQQRGKPREGEGWDEWKLRDTEAVQDMFEKDMQQAILESKMAFEQQQQHQGKKTTEDQEKTNAPVNDNKSGKQKKKKKTGKPQTMSLEEFKQMPAEVAQNSDDEEVTADPAPPPVHTRLPLVNQDPHYFENLKTDAEKIVQKERIHEEYKKQYAQESLMSSKYRELLEKKDGEIAELQTRLKDLEEELKQVKKRNKQLCFILAQGEMKDKAQVLMQVEELTAVKDELTEQVSRLTADLEKERSKVHALKLENDKLKVSC
ncbi:hypothetical protein C0Q70_19777 [Pomacea canaliculata]|uniref:G kinase-anchoring protein 1 n=1 Tax=Pomacea canaliculata TaxID=400727 RepID=A0A2T7NDN6_POMCA|nr:hypothetical protein C0Q70_19777 [Pomacea canaliculata]